MTAIKLLTALLAGTALATSAFADDSFEKKDDTAMAKSVSPNANVDSDLKAVLDAQASLKPKPIETLTPSEAREQPTPTDGVKLVMKAKGMSTHDSMGVSTKELTYPTDGGTQKARVYIPESASPDKPLPVIVYYHGGGWVIADIDVYDASPRAMAKGVNAIVVSVEYRKAPEHKFPAAHEDALNAYQWVMKHASEWGGDLSRVAVMGESAGGNLAINTAIAARDTNVPMPIYEVLVYPVAGTDMSTKSYMENANAKPLNKAMMGWFVKQVVRTDDDMKDPRIDLVEHADLKGLPPTTVITAQIDPLRSEGQDLAEKLKHAGVNVDAKTYNGMTHEFFGMGAVVASAKDAEDLVSADLKKAFGNRPPV